MRLRNSRDCRLEGDVSVSGAVINAALAVHSELGPGLLESAYLACMVLELRARGLAVRSEVPVPVRFRGVAVDVAYRMDLLVDEMVIVETKAVTKLMRIHEAQLLSYLRLSGLRIGLLINFHSERLKDGIRRILNG